AYPKGKRIQPQWHAAAVVELEVDGLHRLHFHARIKSVVSHQVSSTSLHAGVQVPFTIRTCSAGAAFGASAAPKHAADHGLRAPRRDVLCWAGNTYRPC